MLTRRKFLAGAIAAAVAPSVSPVVRGFTTSAFHGTKHFDAAAFAGHVETFHVSDRALTLEEIRKVVAAMRQHHAKPIMHNGVPCYRLETFSGRRMVPLGITSES